MTTLLAEKPERAGSLRYAATQIKKPKLPTIERPLTLRKEEQSFFESLKGSRPVIGHAPDYAGKLIIPRLGNSKLTDIWQEHQRSLDAQLRSARDVSMHSPSGSFTISSISPPKRNTIANPKIVLVAEADKVGPRVINRASDLYYIDGQPPIPQRFISPRSQK